MEIDTIQNSIHHNTVTLFDNEKPTLVETIQEKIEYIHDIPHHIFNISNRLCYQDTLPGL